MISDVPGISQNLSSLSQVGSSLSDRFEDAVIEPSVLQQSRYKVQKVLQTLLCVVLVSCPTHVGA